MHGPSQKMDGMARMSAFPQGGCLLNLSGCAGLRTTAFFFGHQVMHLIDIVVQPAIFMSVYYTLTLPEIKFINYYISMPQPAPHRICA